MADPVVPAAQARINKVKTKFKQEWPIFNPSFSELLTIKT
jgi:hypothetical protein